MLLKASAITTLVAVASAAVPLLNSTQVVSNIKRLDTLTLIAIAVNRYVVHVNNPPRVRFDVIGIANAIGTQSMLDQYAMTGKSCGTLSGSDTHTPATAAYSLCEQQNVTDAYATFANTTHEYTTTLNRKYAAIKAHNATVQVAAALNSTLTALKAISGSILGTIPDQNPDFVQMQNSIVSDYTYSVNLFHNGLS